MGAARSRRAARASWPASASTFWRRAAPSVTTAAAASTGPSGAIISRARSGPPSPRRSSSSAGSRASPTAGRSSSRHAARTSSPSSRSRSTHPRRSVLASRWWRGGLDAALPSPLQSRRLSPVRFIPQLNRFSGGTAMDPDPSAVSRRDLLKLAGAAVTAGAAGGSLDLLRPGPADAQTPKRGGVLRLAGFDAPHFDPHQTPHWWTFIYTSLTHGGLVRYKAGPSVQPGTLPIEPHLAESWERPNDTTYIFKLRKGVRFHNKPPVNGRELTADDVVFTFQRALTIKGNPNRTVFEEIDKVEALDRYTVRFTMKEPFAWFLNSPAVESILPKEAADKDGMFKTPETVIGTGPWMLERYEPNVRVSFVRNPNYFQSGLPYADAVEFRIDTDPASKLAAWLSGQ